MTKPVPTLALAAFTGEMEATEPQQRTHTLSTFEHLRITTEKEYPNNEPVITWDGSGIAAAGNITAISAQAKAGKTAFVTMLLAGAISEDGFCDLFSSIEVKENADKKAVIVFDTEQAEADQQYNVRTTLRRAGYATTPEHFLSYNIRQLHVEEYKDVTDSICEAAAAEFGGIHSIYIDGVADYITDVNSVEQATQIREYFTLLAIKYQCPVILVIHQNPGSTKERGHLGSEIQRKCYGIINISKEDGISVAKNSFSRKAGELPPIYFNYSTEKGYHIEVEAPVSNTQKHNLNKVKKIITDALPTTLAATYSELVTAIVGMTVCSDRTAQRYIQVACANGWIEKGEDERYRHVLPTTDNYRHSPPS